MTMTDTLPDLEWVEAPPERSGFRGKYEAHKAALEARPNKWAKVSTHADSKEANSAAGSFRKQDGFESAVRKVGGEHHLYARHVPVAV